MIPAAGTCGASCLVGIFRGHLPWLHCLGSCPTLPECGLCSVTLTSTSCPETTAWSAPADDPHGPSEGAAGPRGRLSHGLPPPWSGVAGFGSSGGLNPGLLETQLLQRFLRPTEGVPQPTPLLRAEAQTHIASRCLCGATWGFKCVSELARGSPIPSSTGH